MIFTVEWRLQVPAIAPAMIYPSLWSEATAVAPAEASHTCIDLEAFALATVYGIWDLKSIEMNFVAHSLLYLTFDIDSKQYADFQPERAPVNPQLDSRGVSSVCIAIASVLNGSERPIPVCAQRRMIGCRWVASSR